jgi:divalent metal cation (Fe/Co/Zn/Cd) transporter
MKLGQPFEFPPEQAEARRKARRLSWISLGLLFSGTVGLALTLGGSQAMKTAWISDLLSLVPPITILVAMRQEEKKPSARFPYGYFRSISVAFLATAAALMIIGLWLFVENVMKLLAQQRPPIGAASVLGHVFPFWAGWLMLAPLTYSIVCAVVVGQLKRPVAMKLHDKVLMADADMNRAEWMSEGAAVIGLLLVGFGFWWGDSATAAIISLQVMHDGWHNLRQVIGDLMDESPTEMGAKELEDLPREIKDAAERLPWVRQAAVRLREHGHVLSGEVFVVPDDGDGTADFVKRLDETAEALKKMDWRLYSLSVVPTADLEDAAHPKD